MKGILSMEPTFPQPESLDCETQSISENVTRAFGWLTLAIGLVVLVIMIVYRHFELGVVFLVLSAAPLYCLAETHKEIRELRKAVFLSQRQNLELCHRLDALAESRTPSEKPDSAHPATP
ncbi:MAG: hypothetical protein IJV65_10645 [Kiritimatiellae bacterium]|nr:hypothetical protein [Kiritimatiellia bacterium]